MSEYITEFKDYEAKIEAKITKMTELSSFLKEDLAFKMAKDPLKTTSYSQYIVKLGRIEKKSEKLLLALSNDGKIMEEEYKNAEKNNSEKVKKDFIGGWIVSIIWISFFALLWYIYPTTGAFWMFYITWGIGTIVVNSIKYYGLKRIDKKQQLSQLKSENEKSNLNVEGNYNSKFCPICGATNKSESEICPSCGGKI